MAKVQGIRGGQHRRLTAEEIGRIVRNIREGKGLKQGALAAEADVVERTLGRLESGQSVSEETYRRVARALGISPSLFLEPQYVPTPEEAVEMIERQAVAVEAAHTRVTLKPIGEARDVREVIGADALWFDDSRVAEKHASSAAMLKETLQDSMNIRSDLAETQRVEDSRQALARIREFESQGYQVSVGETARRSRIGSTRFTLAVVVLAPRSVPADSVLVPKEMTFS